MNIDNLRILGLNFKIKDHLFDLFLLLIFGLLTSAIFSLLNKPLHDGLRLVGLPNNYDILPLPLELAEAAVWILLFLSLKPYLYALGKNWLFRHPRAYGFDSQKDKLTDERFLKEWVFQGNVQPLNGGLLVSNSNSGCLIKSGHWKNFTANIEFEFPAQTLPLNPASPHSPSFPIHNQWFFEDYVGIIFRAQSFEDYLMLELTMVGTNLIVRPHIRWGGNWDAPLLNIDRNSLPLTGSVISLNFVANEETVEVSAGNDSVRWLLPTHIERNIKQQPDDTKEDKIKNLSKNVIPEIYFRGITGMFGFRCYGNQVALIRSLEIG